MKPFQKWLLWSSSAATGLTGVVYWWMENMMEPADAWAAINHPLQPWVLKAHIVVAPVLVFAVGLVAAEHIWRHFRAGVRRGRRSGVLAMGVFVPMVLSGYLIQAVTHVGLLEALVWVHLITGVLYLLGVALHLPFLQAVRVKGRAEGAQERRSPPAEAPVPVGRAAREAGASQPVRRPASRVRSGAKRSET